MLSKLIEALQIFLKYGDPQYPTYCRDDLLFVCISPDIISKEDKKALEKLGFIPDNSPDELDCFVSYNYSC